jgi:hypothetical protein
MKPFKGGRKDIGDGERSGSLTAVKAEPSAVNMRKTESHYGQLFGIWQKNYACIGKL